MDIRFVPSLELCKELKEMRWKRPTTFQWSNVYLEIIGNPPEIFKREYRLVETPVILNGSEYPAPLSDEILEELPTGTIIIKHEDNYSVKSFSVCPPNKTRTLLWKEVFNKSLPDALSQMWLYLKKEGIIK